MAYTQRDNSGSSWKNDRKREGKKDSDYCGNITVNGVQFWLDTWIVNNPRSPEYDPEKKTFLSHSVRPKEARNEFPKSNQPPRRQAPAPPPPANQPAPEDHSINPNEPDIPFRSIVSILKSIFIRTRTTTS